MSEIPRPQTGANDPARRELDGLKARIHDLANHIETLRARVDALAERLAAVETAVKGCEQKEPR